MSRGFLIITGITERARREVGAWPTAQVLADRLLDALERAADAEPDEARRGRLRELVSYLGGAARDVVVEVAGSALSHFTRM